MNNDLITIIVPIYNVETYLDRCIKSITCQTYPNLQIILIDDGSTDKSGVICDEYAAIDSRIEVFHQVHQGASSARNVGLNHSKGDYIGFVDSDDWIEPEMYESMLKALKEYDVDAVRCNYKAHYTKKSVSYLTSAEKKVLPGRDAVINMYTHSNSSGHGTIIWNTLFKSNILANPEQLLFDTNLEYGEDSDLLRQLLVRCDGVVLIPNNLYNYNRTNLMSTTHSVNFECRLKSSDKAIAFLEDNSFSDELIFIAKKNKENTMIRCEIESYISGDTRDTKLIDSRSFFAPFFEEKMITLGIIKFYIVVLMIKHRISPKLVSKIWHIHR